MLSHPTGLRIIVADYDEAPRSQSLKERQIGLGRSLAAVDHHDQRILISGGLQLGGIVNVNVLDGFIIRLDGGMKAYNPSGRTMYRRLPLVHPDFSRDFAFHLAVGYPF